MRVRFVPLTLLLFLSGSFAVAQELGAWQFGSSSLRDTRQQFAALTATTLLSGGDKGDYAPVLTISCNEGDGQHWQQQLQLEEPLTSRGIITLWVSYDGSEPAAQQWVVTGNRRTATLVSSAAVARLARSRNLKLQWNWGWSWLWLTDSVEFQLGDPHTVVFALSKSCSLPEPR